MDLRALRALALAFVVCRCQSEHRVTKARFNASKHPDVQESSGSGVFVPALHWCDFTPRQDSGARRRPETVQART